MQHGVDEEGAVFPSCKGAVQCKGATQDDG
jgi:hypothetical protein